MNISERGRTILDIIVKEHIKTAEPVGSSIIVQKYNVGLSPATVRNVMSNLEEMGYIAQPYTSAGRIPTKKAYDLHMEEIKEKKLSNKSIKTLDQSFKKDLKKTAKALAQLSDGAVFWTFDNNDIYYTGLSKLLHQPEFRQSELILDISEMMERLDEIVFDMFDEIGSEVEVLIGPDNPFNPACTSVVVKYESKQGSGMFGILGPMRLDYPKIIALVNHVRNKLK